MSEKLWHKTTDEKSVQYLWFTRFRDMPLPRTIKKFHKAVKKEFSDAETVPSLSTFKRWSAEFDWQDRVDAWDEDGLARATEAQEKHRLEMIEKSVLAQTRRINSLRAQRALLTKKQETFQKKYENGMPVGVDSLHKLTKSIVAVNAALKAEWDRYHLDGQDDDEQATHGGVTVLVMPDNGRVNK
jgi:hypothetical protein